MPCIIQCETCGKEATMIATVHHARGDRCLTRVVTYQPPEHWLTQSETDDKSRGGVVRAAWCCIDCIQIDNETGKPILRAYEEASRGDQD